ncbi:MAG: hypothetical protein HRU37_06250 [Roseibacillus sp.]|nr:hypothetical protein [Roseibacillus sp.]
MKFFFLSPALQTPRKSHIYPRSECTVSPSVSVVDGSICLEFARADNAAFFRFSEQWPRTLFPAPCCGGGLI